MKTLNKFFTATTLAVALLGASTAWGDPTVVGGNVIVERPVVDGASNFYLVDTNQPINADGKLDRWEIFAGSTLPVQLVIYRQVYGKFYVVGRSKEVTPKQKGYNAFKLRPEIKVKAGDFVGAYHPYAGTISFNFDPPYPPSAFGQGDLTGTTLFSFDKANKFSLSSNRRYSIRVMGESNDKKPNLEDSQ